MQHDITDRRGHAPIPGPCFSTPASGFTALTRHLWRFALLSAIVVWTMGIKCNLASAAKGTKHAVAPVARRVSPATLRIAWVSQAGPERQTPYFDSPATDAGIAGSRLGIADNNTTGQFTGQDFTLHEVPLEAAADVRSVFKQLISDGFRLILANVSESAIMALPEVAGFESALVFDIGSRDDGLRGPHCAANVLHLLPSRAMRADALAQFLLAKRWTKWFLVSGPNASDQAYAAAVKRSARRFGGKIVAEKAWAVTFDERRTPESTVPVFTQGVDYDVLVVADEEGSFGDLLAYRTWLPRPVAGTHGLVPTAWHPTHEAWGALQLQKRFRERAGRLMTELDYGAWLAVRAIGEAATRTHSVDFATLRDYLVSEQFTLAGFKGVPLSFRVWDRQLRQPVLLAHPRSLVAVAPVEGIIHPKNELDTLGYDESESACRLGR